MSMSIADIESEIEKAAKASIKILKDREAKPDQRAQDLTVLMIGMAKIRSEIEIKRARAVRKEKKVFSQALKGVDKPSREERLAVARGAETVQQVSDDIAIIESLLGQAKLLIAGIKHGILVMRGLMGMKE